jgi:hypothetical protein
LSEDAPLGGFRAEALRPSPNGSQLKGKRGSALVPLLHVLLGAMLGALVATSIIPRLHLRNLAVFNPWPRPVIAAGVGGALTGLLRRSSRWWETAGAAAVAGVVSLWLPYGLMRASQGKVLFAERTFVSVFAADWARLAAYGAPAGAVAAALATLTSVLTKRARKPRA